MLNWSPVSSSALAERLTTQTALHELRARVRMSLFRYLTAVRPLQGEASCTISTRLSAAVYIEFELADHHHTLVYGNTICTSVQTEDSGCVGKTLGTLKYY